MPKKSKSYTSRPLIAGQFYRLHEGPNYFGFSLNRQDDLIKSGQLPPPISPSDNGRAKGWFGRTILKWQEEREAASAKQSAA